MMDKGKHDLLTRPFSETVRKRVERDPAFALALVEEQREEIGRLTVALKTEKNADDFSRHEVLHVAWMVQDMIDRYLAQHTAVEANPEWKRLADELVAKACEFYQRIGADTLGAGEDAAGLDDQTPPVG